MGKNTKQTLIAVGVMLIGLYRLGSPYMEETDTMRKEAEKLGQEIMVIRDEMAQYSEKWEEKMNKTEKTVKDRLPDNVNSSDILDYFVSKFEAANVGRAWFIAVSQAPTLAFALDPTKGNQKESPRVSRYKFEAQMNQDRVVAYIEHIEKYAGLFMVNDYSFHVEKDISNGLKMDMNLLFFLAPKEWTLPEEKAKKKTGKPGEDDEDDDKAEKKAWRPIFLSNIVDPTKSAVRKPAFSGASDRKLPPFQKIVGRAVVANENLYEEGDKINGWTVQSVDGVNGVVTLKSGSTIRKVVVK